MGTEQVGTHYCSVFSTVASTSLRCCPLCLAIFSHRDRSLHRAAFRRSAEIEAEHLALYALRTVETHLVSIYRTAQLAGQRLAAMDAAHSGAALLDRELMVRSTEEEIDMY